MSTKQGSTHNTKEGKMLGRVDLETQRKSHKCILVLKCLNELVPPYLSGYFIKNLACVAGVERGRG